MRKKVPIALKLDADLLDRLDKCQSKLSPPVTRTAIIETAVQEWLDRREGKKPRPRAEASSGRAGRGGRAVTKPKDMGASRGAATARFLVIAEALKAAAVGGVSAA